MSTSQDPHDTTDSAPWGSFPPLRYKCPHCGNVEQSLFASNQNAEDPLLMCTRPCDAVEATSPEPVIERGTLRYRCGYIAPWREFTQAGLQHVATRYVAAQPHRPLYIPLLGDGRTLIPSFAHWPVMTPDKGVLMCSTYADAQRVALTLNELLDRIEQLEGRKQ